MKLAVITGKVWASHKDPQLNGVKLYVIQPVDEKQDPLGKPLIAADTIGAGQGDLVYWVGSREATYAFDGRVIPSDASIVGLVDNLYTKSARAINSDLAKWKKQRSTGPEAE